MSHGLVFTPPFRVSVDDSVSLVIYRVFRRTQGELVASIQCWNGSLVVFSDDVKLGIARDRSRFAKVVAVKLQCPGLQSSVEQTLMECEPTLAAKLDEARLDQPLSGISQVTRLVALATSDNVELFHSPEEQSAYATVKINDHYETYAVYSSPFRSWLSRAFFLEEGLAPSRRTIEDALNTVDGIAKHDGQARRVYTRFAMANGKLYWDLCDERWRQVELSSHGYRLIDAGESPVRFRRALGMQPLPAPQPGGRLADLRPFFNLPDEDDFVMLVGWMIGAMRADAQAFPVLCLFGEQGSAKSSAARFIRLLLDPNKAPLRGRLREERDLLISTLASWIVSVDNVSKLTQEQSDMLCRLSTGYGFAKRKLYSDDEEVIFQATRPAVITGIPEVVESADLVDRAIVIEMPPIPEEERRDERAMLRDFETARPKLMGALCDAVSEALRNLDSTRIDRPPRMADFAIFVTAAEGTFTQPGFFIEAYRRNRKKAYEMAMRASEIAGCIVSWFQAEEATISLVELLPVLNQLYRKEKASGEDPLRVKLPDTWPKTEKALSNELRRCAPLLRNAGIVVEDAGLESGTKRARRHFIRLTQTEGEPPNPPAP